MVDTAGRLIKIVRESASKTEIVVPEKGVLESGQDMNITIIGTLFYNNDNITSVELGDNITTIEAGAFNYCDKLAKINIPDSVTSIGSDAFSNTPSLDGSGIEAD